MEALPANAIVFRVPLEVDFADLGLESPDSHGARFNWWPIARICEASGLPESLLREGPPLILPTMLNGWLELLHDHGLIGSEDFDRSIAILIEWQHRAVEVMLQVGELECCVAVKLLLPTKH